MSIAIVGFKKTAHLPEDFPALFIHRIGYGKHMAQFMRLTLRIILQDKNISVILKAARQLQGVLPDLQIRNILLLGSDALRIAGFKDLPPDQYTEF